MPLTSTYEDTGYLEIILGPMFSGKTSRLMDIFKKYKICGIPVLSINYSEDIRYSTDPTQMTTHDLNTMPCIHCVRLSGIVEQERDFFCNVDGKGVILINEGQFFPDLYDMVFKFVHTYHKHVYVCGLDGDFRRQSFGQILDLIPICDTVHKHSALCVQCKNGTPAIFSHKTKNQDGAQKEIGTGDMYVPLCRRCYVQSNS
jgi:thymidine kinase